MAHSIYRVSGFQIIGPYRLAVSFDEGTQQRIDFRPVLHGGILGALQDVAAFNRVALDSEAGTLVWPNGADFDPATLHEWPSVCDELAARAQVWADGQRRNRAAG